MQIAFVLLKAGSECLDYLVCLHMTLLSFKTTICQ